MQTFCPKGLRLRFYEGPSTQKKSVPTSRIRKSEFFFSSCAKFFYSKKIEPLITVKPNRTEPPQTGTVWFKGVLNRKANQTVGLTC
jgi:hypothetical protein